MKVLQLGLEHCCAVESVGLVVDGRVVEEEDDVFCAARLRAHAPGLGHSCASSVRWSRQNFSLHDWHLKGRKSSWWQYS